MNRLHHLAIVFLILISIASCTNNEAQDDAIRGAELLMETHPDSALALLKKIDQSSIIGKESKAKYSLLMSMALDKNYIDTTTFDIIQPAIDYYLSKGSADEKLRTYYYQGRIFQNRAFILPDGKVSVCEQMYWHKDFIIGDLKTSSIEDIWNSERALQLFELANSMFRDESNCKRCSHFDECNSKKRRCVVKVVKAYGLSNWDYPDPRCEYAPEFNNDLIY